MDNLTKTINVNGITLAYREFGTGSRYLLSSQQFFLTDCHMELLGKAPYDYHVFCITMRGSGQSTHVFDPEPKDYATIWGEDVIAFAEAMGIEQFYYTGVSHGNWPGWYIAFHRPELIRGFVCCNGIARFTEQMPESYRRMKDRAAQAEDLVHNRERLEKMAWMENWPTENPQRLARRARNHEEHTEILMQREKEEFYVMNSNMAGCEAKTREEFADALHKIPFPVLLWYGGLDPLVTSEELMGVAKAIPGCELLLYQHLGHGGADECPELAARDSDRFFRDTQDRIL